MNKPRRLSKLSLIPLIALLAFALLAPASNAMEARSSSQAAFQMELSDGLLNLGAAFVGREVLPAPSRLGETNLPNWWDIVDSVVAISADPANNNVCSNPSAFLGGSNALFPCGTNPESAIIRGTNTASSNWNPSTGAITLNTVLPAGGGAPWSEPFNSDVRFPIMQVPSPTTGSPVPLTLVASGPVSGSYSNGEVSLASTFEARVLVGLAVPESAGGAQPFTYCKVPLPGMTLSSSSGAFPGTPFVSGLGGAGALQGSYSIADNSIPVTQAGLSPTASAAAAAALQQCATVDLVIQGDGALWVGNRSTVPACKEGQIGTYPNCADPEANISAITLSGKKSVKGGKKAKLTVRVKNTGTADKTVRVSFFANSNRVKVPKAISILVPAGGEAVKSVMVKTKKGKSKVTISATDGSKTARRTLKVR